MEATKSGGQACDNLQDRGLTGAQAIDYEDLLDYEPEEEEVEDEEAIEEEEVPNISRILEENGDQANKISILRNGVPRCDICSQKHFIGYDTLEIHHSHFSSKVSGESFNALSDNIRLKICVTDSALHEHWEDEMIASIGGDFQVLWISIPGARVNELIAAWEIEYRDEARPLDLLMIVGVNNVAEGSPGPNILDAMNQFVDLVKMQGGRIHPSVPNTCVIAPLSYPPSICWFEDDGPVPDNFLNHLRNMRWLNQQIELLNLELGYKAPNFPTLGIRKETRFGRGSTRHRLQHWQGPSRREKVVLSVDMQKKMCRQIAKYFLHNTGDVAIRPQV